MKAVAVRRRMTSRLGAAAIASGVLAACSSKQAPPRPQWVVEISTDALVPQIGDRVLLEIVGESGEIACAECRRDATAARADDWPVSFGIEATDRGMYVRSRLYRGDHIDPTTGQPDAHSTIDQVSKLPPVADQPMTVRVGLRLACLGKPATLPGGTSDAGVGFTTCLDATHVGVPAPVIESTAVSLPIGSSDLLAPIVRGCRTPARAEMACLPGDVFFMGNSLAPAPHSDVMAAPIPERLVAVDSFLMDRFEVKLADFDVWVRQNSCPDPCACAGDIRCSDPTKPVQKFCAFGTTIAGADVPVNCVSWKLADAYCQSQGKRLPTEAEWEFAAGNGPNETRYPWGNDQPTCNHAVLGRDIPSVASQRRDSSVCLTGGNVSGTAPVDAASSAKVLDKTWSRLAADDQSAENSVYGMAGNVAEWTADGFEQYGPTSACWGKPDRVILRNPKCDAKPGSPLSVRGGSWRDSLQASWGSNRAQSLARPIVATPEIGFRCACTVDLSTGNCAKAP